MSKETAYSTQEENLNNSLLIVLDYQVDNIHRYGFGAGNVYSMTKKDDCLNNRIQSYLDSDNKDSRVLILLTEIPVSQGSSKNQKQHCVTNTDGAEIYGKVGEFIKNFSEKYPDQVIDSRYSVDESGNPKTWFNEFDNSVLDKPQLLIVTRPTETITLSTTDYVADLISTKEENELTAIKNIEIAGLYSDSSILKLATLLQAALADSNVSIKINSECSVGTSEESHYVTLSTNAHMMGFDVTRLCKPVICPVCGSFTVELLDTECDIYESGELSLSQSYRCLDCKEKGLSDKFSVIRELTYKEKSNRVVKKQ